MCIYLCGWLAACSIHLLKPHLLSPFFCFAVQSQGAEIVNALALFFLLLLDLFMIGRQERLKCREVERRLQTIIDKINGEFLFICHLNLCSLHVGFFSNPDHIRY